MYSSSLFVPRPLFSVWIVGICKVACLSKSRNIAILGLAALGKPLQWHCKPMSTKLYSARIGESVSIAASVPYNVLTARIIEFTLRATLARAVDRADWEHEELRRKGLAAIQLYCDDKAVWADRGSFEAELAEARREGIGDRFKRENEVDPALYNRLDRDLRALWRSAGYKSPSLKEDMRALFVELERDVSDHEAGARDAFAGKIMKAIS
jgi:hypothetical protein